MGLKVSVQGPQHTGCIHPAAVAADDLVQCRVLQGVCSDCVAEQCLKGSTSGSKSSVARMPMKSVAPVVFMRSMAMDKLDGELSSSSDDSPHLLAFPLEASRPVARLLLSPETNDMAQRCDLGIEMARNDLE